MAVKILRRIYRQSMLLLIVSLVLLAAYVSVGRQFMPAVSRYASFFEQQIFEIVGVPVSIESLTGSFQGFNPAIRIDGLRLLVGGEQNTLSTDASALIFDSATLIVDMPRSVWQRRWVLEDFVVEALEINLEQTEQGDWQLSGMDFSGDTGADIDTIYRSFLRVARLNLRNVGINVQTRVGNRFSLSNGSATIQNQGESHFLHVNANLDQNSRQLAFSLEVEGDELSAINGQLHADIPEADYSALLLGQDIGQISVDEIIGGGDLWMRFQDGQLSQLISRAEVDSVTLSGEQSQSANLQNVEGVSQLTRDIEQNIWELTLADMEVSWEDQYWRPFNVFLSYNPQRTLVARADNLNLSFLTQLALESGLLTESARDQLAQYSPGGALENFDLYLPLDESVDQNLALRTNLASVEVGSVNGSPNMWGLNGYLELDFDRTNQLLTGLAEIESDEYSMNIPNVFTDVWDYSYVNGNLGIQVDLNQGQRVKLVSGTIVAESEAVDGRAQFKSIIHQYPNGEREAELELLVGASRVNGSMKSLYLPDGPGIEPNLRDSMEWLDTAIIDGDVFDSGVIFRGNTLPGSLPETKTFQSYYQLNNGELNFSDEWPQLSALSGWVLTDDNNIDIEVSSGSSMDIDMGAVRGEIRRNEAGENWLTVNGQATGLTSQGLAYLQSAPLGERLKATFADWEAQGDVAADIHVRVPFNQPDIATDVRLNIAVADNTLTIPAYGLTVEQLTGPVIFDTTTGLEASTLDGELFQRPVSLALSSDASDGVIETIYVDAQGGAIPEELIAWPLQSEFVRDLLGQGSGDMRFEARLSLGQLESGDSQNTLVLDSSLEGLSLDLPYPFAKTSTEEVPLHLNILFGDVQSVAGSFGPALGFELALENGQVGNGILYVGEDRPNLTNLVGSDLSGLAILGELDRFQLEQWTDFLDQLGSMGNPSSDLGSAIAFVDVQLDVFELYEQELPDVAMRVEPNSVARSWDISLSSDSVLGTVNVPFDSDDYLLLDLDHLRLPGDEEEEVILDPDVIASQGGAPEIERVDVLVQVDPRELPAMKFATREFTIGPRPYGSWQFTLDPAANGAEISELAFDFRGLRTAPLSEVATEDDSEGSTQQVPHFRWLYDGVNHRSELQGLLHADDIAELLTANGYAASLESDSAVFATDISWPGSPAFFAASGLSGDIALKIEDGRFLQNTGGGGALKLISIINFSAIMRRLRFSDDLLRRGLAYDEISAELQLQDGLVDIQDRLVISGPSSLYQITGEIDLANETILGEMFVTLPVSDNIPWLGLLTANLPLAVGAYLFDRIFGDQVDSLTSAVYTLDGPWETLQPEFKQAFGSPDSPEQGDPAIQ